MSLPTHQKAIWVDTPGLAAEVYLRDDVEVPVPKEGEVLVQLKCTGVWYVFTHFLLHILLFVCQMEHFVKCC